MSSESAARVSKRKTEKEIEKEKNRVGIKSTGIIVWVEYLIGENLKSNM